MLGGGARPRPGDVVPALERLPVPTWSVGLDGTVTWMNRAAVDLLGDLVGRKVPVGFAPESEQTAMNAFARKLIGGAEVTEYEAVMVRPDESRVLVEVSSVRLETDGFVMAASSRECTRRRFSTSRTWLRTVSTDTPISSAMF